MNEYPWSSLPKGGSAVRPAWLETSVFLSEAGGLTDSETGWRSYRAYLEFLATDLGAKKELVCARLSRGWCLGTADFKREMKKVATARGAELEQFQGLEPEAVAQERELSWEESLQALAVTAGIDLTRLAPAKSHPDKALLAAAIKKLTSVSNAWSSTRLSMGAPASASQFARRYQLTEGGRDRVSRLLSRVKT